MAYVYIRNVSVDYLNRECGRSEASNLICADVRKRKRGRAEIVTALPYFLTILAVLRLPVMDHSAGLSAKAKGWQSNQM